MEYKHFSHQHTLTLHKTQPNQHQHLQCHACNQPCTTNSSILACWTCNFFLHEHCANANRFVKHPSHPLHPLVLMPTPTYCSGSFLCNACGAPGSTFSYTCPLCEVDLHVNCAFLPPRIVHHDHHHGLSLSFAPREKSEYGDYCRACRKEMSGKSWAYLCDESGCDFRVHTFCGTSEVKPGMYLDDRVEEGRINGNNENTSVDQMHVRTEWTPEEMALEIARMRMEFDMAQALANIIAFR